MGGKEPVAPGELARVVRGQEIERRRRASELLRHGADGLEQRLERPHPHLVVRGLRACGAQLGGHLLGQIARESQPFGHSRPSERGLSGR